MQVRPASPGTSVSGSKGSLAALSDGYLFVPDSSSNASSPASAASAFSNYSEYEKRIALQSHSPGTLDSTELGLLSHFLTHTSQTIPFDDVDLYALSVGVPNLAFNSRPVMSSLLALAAACKSHDLAKQAQDPLDRQVLGEIRDLLTLADDHHRISLQHIQAAVPNSEWHDNVLANAALMVLHTYSSHAIRVYLATAAKRSGLQLPAHLLPQHSQWIMYTRVAHTASTAVLDSIVKAAAKSLPTKHTPPDPQSIPRRASHISPEDGPSPRTRSLFLPLVGSTWSRAVDILRGKTDSLTSHLDGSEFFAPGDSELHICRETLAVLEQCAASAFSTRDGDDKEEVSTDDAISSDTNCRVSGWVGRYMVRVTSMTSQRALRRIIMSFLNQTPVGYLNLVQSVLEMSPAETSSGSWSAHDSPATEAPTLSTPQLLAMEIFAHWLVLVMLLDGVWWIGDIGQWELGQVVSLIKSQHWIDQSDAAGTWWPESMYQVKRELTAGDK
ncbi:uncharacterized protein E0L32_005296 [Thyridium curvatum]|uniref:C6 transcription factor n=1 Tax=Thyridium curvatum TaxID=1093900 RepID=A0A507B7J0_9PEZI|nr:uncharacterized protein E0L32_005296 [Thyridium curvatum]TPX14604.1 hypothetical protein E0L32_005296 [Thyridium curvatum]